MRQRIRLLLALAMMLLGSFQPLQAHSLAASAQQAALQHMLLHAEHSGHGHDLDGAEPAGHDAAAVDQLHQQLCHAGYSLFTPDLYCASSRRLPAQPLIVYALQPRAPAQPVEVPPPKA